jgi:hypothetical protein
LVRGFRLRRWQAVLLAIFGLFLLTTSLEIGGSTPAEASALCCPAGYSLSPPNFCYPAVGPPVMAVACNTVSFLNIFTDQLGMQPLYNEIPGPGSDDSDDPAGQAMWTRGKAVTGTGPAGAVTASGYHSTDLSGEADGHINASKTFNLAGDQRLYLGLMINYDNQRADYDVGGSLHRDIYTATGFARYAVGDTSVGLMTSLDWGNGVLTDPATGGVGNFDTAGYQISGWVRHEFTLFDNTSHSAPRVAGMVTKAPPKITEDGYRIGVDLTAALGNTDEQVDGFTDSAGTVRGSEIERFWAVDAQARLFDAIYYSGATWTPYAAASVEQRFDYSHLLELTTGIANIDDARTFVGASVGLNVLESNGTQIGLKGFYDHSADINDTGVQAYVRFPILAWLGVAH